MRTRRLTSAALAVALMGLFCCAVARAAFPPIALEPITQGEIVAPVAIANAGDGSNRLFIADQRGKIYVHNGASLLATPLIDLGSKLVAERPGFDERGLLGLAFHPNFGQAGQPGADKFYVYYSAPRPGGDPNDPANPIDHQSVVAEYAVTGLGANTASVASERILLTFDQPQFNHNAGSLNFGPDDGLLYITTGDGGGANDNRAGHTGGSGGVGGLPNPPVQTGVLGNAQDRTNLLGKVLRIDVHGTNGPGGQYGIPGDNPLVGAGGGVREEIYAYGLRNPWRAAFDDGPGGDGRFYVADVGQGDVEEINLVASGGNYGWRIKEGAFDFDPGTTPDPVVPLIDPIAQYAHPGSGIGLPEYGISVTGGVVHRGASSSLHGKYLFGDFSQGFSPGSGRLLGLEETSPGVFDLQNLNVIGGNPLTNQYVLAFGLDESGEAYLATKATLAASGLDANNMPTGIVYRIVAVPEPSASVLTLVGLVGLSQAHRVRRRR